ncbi:hypothetical protein LGL08_21800 [Clostridium estertheticum]|uniref:hypothetical protein n=1 Tax=Clostridium estertheticum TaxID=238834 RepID=UPI001CF37AFD|nr:hypothetical protein [Clostridium estertheticum]MCB2309205.1 hypothetical protein [Clostridium estertheticum]MCB2347568.1 hypothetical protein [Clostridium estertheticum]MCB2352161.1 hypothetical protein [Clostridium estertheticum]WAG48345.1 hypothetical protein LL127_22325 [Clostridium estertheticum]
MTDNNKFLSEWLPIHQKGIIVYVSKYTLTFLATYILAFIIIITINGSIKTEKTGEILKYSIVSILFYTLAFIYKWTRSEKKYKEIVDEQDN